MRHRMDRISSLPDEVICHILSFLPTKNSVATSILSKRWSPLWRSVPTLHLDDDERTQSDESYLRFAMFVYSFLLFTDATQPLKYVDFENDGYLSELLSGSPNLVDFKAKYVSVDNIHDDRLREFKSLTKLIRAYICESHIKISLELICNVEYLYLYVYAKVFPDYKCIPTFCNLTNLELYFCSYYSWQLILEVLKHCPVLQILVLLQEMEEPRNEEEDWVSPKSTPECISSKLRECSIHNCEGDKGELQFARYIMGKARVLQTMEIYPYYKLDSSEWLKMKKKLSSCKKRSATCRLIF